MRLGQHLQTIAATRVCLTVALVIAVTGAAGCQPPRHAAAAHRKHVSSGATTAQRQEVSRRPLIDFGKGAGGFPLDGDRLPTTREGLVASLAAGYRERVETAEQVTPIIALGADYPHLDALVVDLSDARIRANYRPSLFHVVGGLEPALTVKYLEYVATPLRYSDGSTHLRLVAHDVTVGLLRGRRQAAALVLTDARDGRVDFRVSVSDLERMMLSSARAGGARAGYRASDVKLTLSSDNSRSLRCEMLVSGTWLLVPTSFRITGRIDIDGDFFAHISEVSCTGTDVGGVLLAGFIDGAIRKHDGRVMPLAAFPGDRIRLRDVQIEVDDSVNLRARFGS